MDFYVCGPGDPTHFETKTDSLKVHSVSTSVDQLSPQDIQNCLDESDDEWIGFGSAPAIDCANRLNNAAIETRSDNVAAIVAVRESPFSLSSLWSQLHPYIACLACNPFDIGAVAFRKSALAETSSRNAPCELWDRLLQLATTPKQFQVLDCQSQLAATDIKLPRLAPGRPSAVQSWIVSLIRSLNLKELGLTTADLVEVTALKAGLLQIHDALDESHSHSQSIEGQGRYQNGDYWHAIMHRREPDYSNAKYWFRHVGTHPIFDELAEFAQNVDTNSFFERSDWDPFAFVDMCQQAEKKRDSDLTSTAEQIQYQEMLLLLIHTYQLATG